MFMLTSQDGLTTGILGVNSVIQVVEAPSFADAEGTIYQLFVNGIPFGRFKTPEPATCAVEEVKARLAMILSQGANSDVEPQYQVPADIS